VTAVRPLRIAVLAKQVPPLGEFRLTATGRLDRATGVPELNPYCRRAIAQAVELARRTGGECTVVSLGPPSTEDCLREAVACGADAAVLVTDAVFANSDTLATGRALAAALRLLGPFDLVLCGRNSVDADTGQVPAQVAEILGLPMAAGVRALMLDGSVVDARCEHDDGWVRVRLPLPALLTCAERLIGPAKAGQAERASVPAGRLRRIGAQALGAGPWGAAASRTTVGRVRELPVDRRRIRLAGSLEHQVNQAVAALTALGAFDPSSPAADVSLPARVAAGTGPPIAVLAEPGRGRSARELLGEAARLAQAQRGHVVLLGDGSVPGALATAWGADQVVVATAEGDLDRAGAAAAFADWCAASDPWAVLAPSCMWGREVAGRMAVRLDCGLVGDATELTVADDGRLVCWKPALGGASLVEVRCTSGIQMATVRPGVLPLRMPRAISAGIEVLRVQSAPGSSRVNYVSRHTDDCFEDLTTAEVVVAVGAGVPVGEYPRLRPLLDLLGAQLAATRKVTDEGWQPRARQIGITGRSIAPRLLISIGAHGGFNHMVGVRAAGTILAINHDPSAPVFEAADVGVVADWRTALPLLVAAVHDRTVRSTVLTGGDL
jgi:electron transfer flavoprotein alpha subunit